MEPMSESTDAPTPAGPEAPGPAPLSPLLAADPARVGGFWLDARLTASASGVAYAAHDDHDTPAVLLLLSEGAARDAAARDRLAGTVNKMHIDTVLARGGQGQDEGRLAGTFRPAEDPPGPDGEAQAPWVALANDGGCRCRGGLRDPTSGCTGSTRCVRAPPVCGRCRGRVGTTGRAGCRSWCRGC